MTVRLGRPLFGLASLLLGIADIALQDQLISNWQLPGATIFLYVTSIALAIGGIALLVPRTQQMGAVIVGIVYVAYLLTVVPDVFAHPAPYASWGNVFYQLPPILGALIAYVVASPATPHAKAICKASVILLGASNGSFAIEQIEFLSRTASLVPKWMPPNGVFWTIATTIAFGLAAVSMISGYRALLASRLTAVMLAMFVVAVWIPLLLTDPKTHSNWSEGLDTFLIAGVTLIVAELLSGATEERKEASVAARPSSFAR